MTISHMSTEEAIGAVMRTLEALPEDHRSPVAVAILGGTPPEQWAEIAVEWWVRGEWHVDPEALPWLRTVRLGDAVGLLLRPAHRPAAIHHQGAVISHRPNS